MPLHLFKCIGVYHLQSGPVHQQQPAVSVKQLDAFRFRINDRLEKAFRLLKSHNGLLAFGGLLFQRGGLLLKLFLRNLPLRNFLFQLKGLFLQLLLYPPPFYYFILKSPGIFQQSHFLPMPPGGRGGDTRATQQPQQRKTCYQRIPPLGLYLQVPPHGNRDTHSSTNVADMIPLVSMALEATLLGNEGRHELKIGFIIDCYHLRPLRLQAIFEEPECFPLPGIGNVSGIQRFQAHQPVDDRLFRFLDYGFEHHPCHVGRIYQRE